LLLALKALPEILLFPIVLIISLIPLWTSAIFAASAAFATFLCKNQSFWREPTLSLDRRFLFNELGDNIIGRGCHRGVFVHHESLEDIPLVISWDSTKEVQDVILLTHLNDCLGICVGVDVGSISPSGQQCCRFCAEIVILDIPIDQRCVIVDISAVL
jgi:hypothetical protein